MTEPALKPGEVPIISPTGTVVAVPQENVAEAIRRGGKVGTDADVAEATLGGVTGAARAASLGALETTTAGASTALAGEYGVLHGGQAERQSIEQSIRGVEHQNPIAHIAGATAPLLAMPAAAPEALGVAVPEVAGEGLAARAANFAIPKFVQGVAEAGHQFASEGVSEDLLDHDFSAQSYWAHGATPEALIGGALHVGLGAAAAKLGSALGKGESLLGAEGKLAMADARLSDELTTAMQKSGRTSQEASAAFSGTQDLAQQAAADPARRGFFESVADAYAKAHARGDSGVESALKRSFSDSVDRFSSGERTLDKTTKEAIGHSDDLFKGLAKMNDLQFGLKGAQVEKLVDPTKITQQIDTALTLRNAVMTSIDAIEPRVSVGPGPVNSARNVVSKLDKEIREVIDALGRGVDATEASARLYVALDDTKRMLGRMARFGNETRDPAATLADTLYRDHFLPALEDDGLWGPRLGQMQKQTNATFHEGFTAAQRYRQTVGQVLHTPLGRPQYSTEFGKMRGVLAELEHASTPEDVQGMRAEVVQRVIDNTRSRVRAMTETMDLKPGDVAQLKKTTEAANRLESVMKRAHGEAQEFRTLKELKAREMGGGSAGIVRTVTGAVTSPARTMEVLGSLKRAEDAVRRVIGADSKSVVAGEKLFATVRPVGDVEKKIAVRAIQDVKEMASNPHKLVAAVRAMAGHIPDVAPNVAVSMGTTAARLIMYLADHTPEPLPAAFLDPEPRYAESDIEDFYSKLSLGMRPLTALERMQNNTLHEDDREMLQKVFDRLYGEMQLSLLKEYAEAKRKGQLRTMTPQEEQAMSILLGISVNGLQDPGFVAAMQQSAMTDPTNQGAIGAQAAGGGRPRKVEIDVSRLQTMTEKLQESAA